MPIHLERWDDIDHSKGPLFYSEEVLNREIAKMRATVMTQSEKKFPETLYVKIGGEDGEDSWFEPAEALVDLAEMDATTTVATYTLVAIEEVHGGIVHTKKVGP